MQINTFKLFKLLVISFKIMTQTRLISTDSVPLKLFWNFSSFQSMDLVLEFLHKGKFHICSRVISILQIRLFMVFKVLSTFIKIQSVKFNCMDRPTSLQ